MNFGEHTEKKSLKELVMLLKPIPLVIKTDLPNEIYELKRDRIIEVKNAMKEIELFYELNYRHVPHYYRTLAEKTIKRLSS